MNAFTQVIYMVDALKIDWETDNEGNILFSNFDHFWNQCRLVTNITDALSVRGGVS